MKSTNPVIDPGKNAEIQFLEGPHSRLRELKFTIRTMIDLIKGLRSMHFIGPCITFFGSARFKEDHPYYLATRELAAECAKLGFTILTGGGPGIMEAANRGAKDAGGFSVGCNICLPVEQRRNPYLDKWVFMRHFFLRKVLLVKYSFAFIVMPGGFGTLDEFFEALTLIQTHKIDNFPVVIFGRKYHGELLRHIALMKNRGTIGDADDQLYLVTDEKQEVIDLLREKAIRQFGLRPKRKYQPLRWLFEKS
ncbi:TIGR00730 family Rossman fold protein [Mucilaginibacter conchicola]|uniref:Cytokinin riboside 5'-monophosphate phosphoribohydrolase n=1 Tax=Mucilaginibacter conchicola TaxID=2303333 RepID=A0A372NMY6_9SPHI|nr:TIGR00730 family Rossman fold protein [Mucilaginibacter conchicola]RFZ89957.1 TIGR00730 family Rossman fold protein [Mucilaginibacter conchicola]